MVTRHLIYNTHRIAYTLTGSGPSIIFLHGWKMRKETWRHLSTDLISAGYRCIAIDLPGFGESDEPSQAWTPADYATCVEHVLSDLKTTEYALVGHSFGGKVAAQIAIRQNAGLQRLVLFDADLGFTSPGMLKRLFGWLLPFGMSPVMRSTYNRSQGITIDPLRLVTVPLLYVAGRWDWVTSPRQAKILHQLLPDTQVVICKRAGHVPHIEHYVHVRQALLSFLQS